MPRQPSQLINTVKKHMVIDNERGNAFVIDGVNPTRFNGQWVAVKRAARAVLVESAVAMFVSVKPVTGKNQQQADSLADSDRDCCTYRQRLIDKLGDVHSHGGEGKDTLQADTRALLASVAGQVNKSAHKPKTQTGRDAKRPGSEVQSTPKKAKADDKAASKPQEAKAASKGEVIKSAMARKASAKRKTNVAGRKEIVSEASSLVDQDEFFGELEKKVQDSRTGSPEERKRRLKTSQKIPRKKAVKSYEFTRNPDVIAEVLERADGSCEDCEEPAPFRRASNNEPYLEVHHKTWLSRGGKDSVENAIALCPNCHRKIHYGTQGG